MTAVVTAPLGESAAELPVEAAARRRPSFLAAAEHFAVAVALLWWALPMTHATGGRETGALTGALIALLPAVLIVRPWRRLPVHWVALALSVPVAAFGVCMVAPTGWYGGRDAASYAHAAMLALVVLGYARSPQRRLGVAAVVCLAGLEQFTQAFLPWWGGRSPSAKMIGTFYWHDPYAAFLLAPALLGVGLAVRNRAPWRLAGWVCAPLCAAGVVLSTSRASMACLAAGWLLVGLGLLTSSPRRQPLMRYSAVTALSVAALFALTGPPFFAHSSAPLASTARRAQTGESLQVNGGYRTQFWREAIAVGAERPLAAGGFHSMAPASDGLVPASWARSPYAHNGYLQTWADGGLLLAVPFLVVTLAVVLALTRRLLAHLRRRSADGATFVAAVAALALMAHSFVDFDWTYPALLSVTAVLVSLGLSTTDRLSAWAGTSRDRPSLVCGGLAVLVLVAAAATAHSSDATARALAASSRPETTPTRVAALLAARTPLGSYRISAEILAVPGGRGVPPADLAGALAETADAATVDRHLALRRAQALVNLGQPGSAAALTHRVLTSVGSSRGAYAAEAAHVLASAGDVTGGRVLLLAAIRTDAAGADAAMRMWTDAAALLQIEGEPDDLSRCVYAEASRVRALPPGLMTTSPGEVRAGVDCSAVLAQAEGAR